MFVVWEASTTDVMRCEPDVIDATDTFLCDTHRSTPIPDFPCPLTFVLDHEESRGTCTSEQHRDATMLMEKEASSGRSSGCTSKCMDRLLFWKSDFRRVQK